MQGDAEPLGPNEGETRGAGPSYGDNRLPTPRSQRRRCALVKGVGDPRPGAFSFVRAATGEAGRHLVDSRLSMSRFFGSRSKGVGDA